MFLVPAGNVAAWRTGVYSVLAPLLRITARSNRPAEPLPASISVLDSKNVPAAEAARSAATLAADYDRLNAEIVRLRETLQRYRAALQLNGAIPDGPTGIEAAVIARKILWQEPLLGLDKGSADGVRPDAGVMHRGAVVGRIVALAPHASSMALLSHRSMSVGARLADSRVEGVLQGQKSAEGSERVCRMLIVAKELKASVGENVVTSGLDGTFPPGLWLGVVMKITRAGDFTWELAVRPACDENRIEGVHVLTVEGPEVPWPKTPKK
jgi:rod shape-determining protein MreC